MCYFGQSNLLQASKISSLLSVISFFSPEDSSIIVFDKKIERR